jgi:hypothetical protein
MGTILRKRFTFTTLDGIRDAYVAAFSKDGAEVTSLVKHRALFRPSCVRNLVFHKGGLMDEEFQGFTFVMILLLRASWRNVSPFCPRLIELTPFTLF